MRARGGHVLRLKARALRLERTVFRALYRLARLLVRDALEVRLQLNGCLDLCCREVSTLAFRCAWGAGWGGGGGMSECTRAGVARGGRGWTPSGIMERRAEGKRERCGRRGVQRGVGAEGLGI